MGLTVGDSLGHYAIASRLGAGGMGEVFRASDSRLKRDVAVKILPPEFARDFTRRARFEQEAHAAAALNHPNIVALFDIGEHGDISYIVTELVSGETLSSLIQRGPINIRKLLDIAVQIADGMAAAHAAHITHRDLKPANIMVAADGRVKILDFGLARQTVASGAATGETLTQHTQPGMVVGTASYMSPEQARGAPVDFRSDQFSFGLVLYEMVTGRRAFQKPESVQTLAAILTDEAPAIERSIPAPLHWIIDRCLCKDPAGRYESTRDLYQELRDLRDHLSEASTSSHAVPVEASRGWNSWLIPTVSALCVLLAFVAGGYLATRNVVDQAAYRFTPFALDPGGQFFGAWSPDGKAVAYAGRVRGKLQVFVRYLDSPVPVLVTHTSENAYAFGWTPDGQRILFWSDEQPLGVWSISAAGGDPEPLMTLDRARDELTTLTSSPDFKAIAVLHKGDDWRFGVWISSPPGTPLKKYSPDPFATREVFNQPALRFSPDGKRLLLFIAGEHAHEESWLLPYPPDASHPPKRILQTLPAVATPGVGWMPDSRRMIVSTQASAEGSAQLWMADTAGSYHALTSGTINRFNPSVSPDGKKILFTESPSNFDIVSANLDSAAAQQVVATERNELMPAWAAKQWAMAYVTDRNGPTEIWLRNGETDRPIVTAGDFAPGTTRNFWGPALAPDASRVIYARTDTKGGTRLWISSVNHSAPSLLTRESDDVEFPGSWSPDAVWFTYYATRSGKRDLMKAKTNGQAVPTIVKADVNAGPLGVPSWSPDGNWICVVRQLLSPDGQKSLPLPAKRSPAYVFSADGKRVYGIRPEGERQLLFYIELATGNEKVVGDLGKDFRPGSSIKPSVRFSLAPDGKSFVFGAFNQKANLWLLEGFERAPDLLSRLGLR